MPAASIDAHKNPQIDATRLPPHKKGGSEAMRMPRIKLKRASSAADWNAKSECGPIGRGRRGRGRTKRAKFFLYTPGQIGFMNIFLT
ncbi:MAG: hypothetical protein DBX55_04290 [Verrucomicrobia bacterium]|nr:MAG: hypothetical protein DBX55_04290 [Verrucomicrobiota bacterium]